MNDPLHRALSKLPRHRAGDGFTERLNARLDRDPPRGRRPRGIVPWAVAVLVLLAAGITFLHRPRPVSETPEGTSAAIATQDGVAKNQLEEMQLQTERLSHELAELRGMVEEAEPVVYLGGDEHLGILLPRNAPQGTFPTPVRVVPASGSIANRL